MDLHPGGPSGTDYLCLAAPPSVGVDNFGQLATGAFDVSVTLRRDGNLVQTYPFTVQGILGLPSELRGVATTRWDGRLPDGRATPLRMDNGFLWPLSAWFAQVGARVGDVLVVTFYMAEARVEFNEILTAGDK